MTDLTKGGEAVIIAGGGIAGLTTALGLMRAGISVKVLEQAPELREVGAAVSLAPNATRALDSLGVAEPLRAVANKPLRAAIKHYRTGKELSGYSMGPEMEARWGKPYLQLLRADLHKVLADAVLKMDPQSLVLGAKVKAVTQDGQRVQVQTEVGHFEGPCLIGADGVRSAVRQALHGDGSPNFTGYVAWRGVVPMSMLKKQALDPDTAVYLGPHKSLLRYRVRGLEALNVVGFARVDQWTDEGWSLPADPKELLSVFGGWHEEADEVFHALAEVGAFKWGLFGRKELPRWQVGRVSLVGDAAHPMLPFLGQGAAMAIEDGVLMARAIAAVPDVEAALSCYERARHERACNTVRRSDAQGLRVHSYAVDAVEGTPVPRDDFVEFDFDASTTPLPLEEAGCV